METAVRLHWLRRLSVLTVVWIFLLMVVGAWVKANGAGLSCPDWPQCYGKWLPPFPSYENGGVDQNGHAVGYTQAQILYEWTHRAIVGLLIVPIGSYLLLSFGATGFSTPVRILPRVGAGLYVFQAFLGAVTVAVGNKPWATTAHLATAVTFLLTYAICMMFVFLRPFHDPTAAAGPTAAGMPGQARQVFPGEVTTRFPGETASRGPVRAPGMARLEQEDWYA